MNFKSLLFLICFFSLSTSSLIAQNEELIVKKDSLISLENEDINPLAPATAGFYSAILPGLGQAYNKKYFRIPFVYGALATPLYFHIRYRDQFNRYRTAFELMEAGKPHEFDGNAAEGHQLLSRETLIRAQKRARKYKDETLFYAIGAYVLQIVEASVTAHLMQLNTSDNLAMQPKVIIDPMTNKVFTGLSITYSFK